MTDRIEPFALRSFEEEAQALVEEARARAAEIVRAAEEEGVRIRAAAAEAGRSEGFAEGREVGAREERARVAAETAGLRDLLSAMARSVGEKRAALAAAAEAGLVRLAVAVAEKILRAELASGRNPSAAAVRRAVQLVASRHELRIRIHPADAAMIEAQIPELRREFADLGAVAVEPAPEVARGGCVVLTREGGVDADLATQLAEIERGLLS